MWLSHLQWPLGEAPATAFAGCSSAASRASRILVGGIGKDSASVKSTADADGGVMYSGGVVNSSVKDIKINEKERETGY